MRYQTLTYPNGWRITGHAQRRLDQMGLTATRVFEAISAPRLTYPAHTDRWSRPRELRALDDLVVVVTPEDHTVITVMWHGASGRKPNGLATSVPPP